MAQPQPLTRPGRDFFPRPLDATWRQSDAVSTPRLRSRLAEWFAIAFVVTATLAVSGCSQVMSVVETGPISQKLAEDYARLGAGASVQSIEVVSSRLSTYGVERPGGLSADAAAQVWAVVLSGAFPYGSCDIGFNLGSFNLFASGPPKPQPTFKPCNPPAMRERILVDARNGHIIERIVPG
jgi:hypothetical protein